MNFNLILNLTKPQPQPHIHLKFNLITLVTLVTMHGHPGYPLPVVILVLQSRVYRRFRIFCCCFVCE